MRTEKDVEAYLLRSNRRYRAVDSPEGHRRTFFVDSGAGKPPVAVLVDPPLVVLRAHIGDLAKAPGAGGPGGAARAQGRPGEGPGSGRPGRDGPLSQAARAQRPAARPCELRARGLARR